MKDKKGKKKMYKKNAFLRKMGKFISRKRKGKNKFEIKAEIISHSKKFSFARTLSNESEEIFIKNGDLKGAILGDKVIIHKIKDSQKGKSGVVKNIFEKGNHILSGKAVLIDQELKVICDFGVRYEVPVERGYSIGAKHGDKVKIYLLNYDWENTLVCRVIKIYGNSESAKICADAIVDSYDIPTNFSEETINYSKEIENKKISDEEIKKRTDFRKELIFTIDGEDAKDLDDAISVKKIGDIWELGVHIADVSYFVKYNSCADREAFVRGTSVYFADRVIPMLPEAISNGVCSLNPGEDKLTFSVIIHMDRKGDVLDYKFQKSIINSKVRGIYSEVNDIFSGDADYRVREKYACLADTLKNAKELSDILGQQLKDAGSIEISSSESKFTLDENGKCIMVEPRIQGIAEKMIENFMIKANSIAASYGKEIGVPFVYRVHEEPEPKKIENLSKIINLLGIKTKKLTKGLKAVELSEVIEKANGTNAKRILSKQILQTLAKAKYDTKPIGHFGLSIEDYCHFTSPIRRYPDICVHRILSATLEDFASSEKYINIYKKKVESWAKESTLCEIRAMKAERETEKHYMAEFMSCHIDEVYEGVIRGANAKGVFVELENSVSGFLDLNSCEGCEFVFDGFMNHFDKKTGNKLSLGDSIKVKIASADVSLGTIDLIWVR